jgi:tRNA(adenine34) deaminase|tara:strand:- start:10172 stop:10651 length:480 start_codon:yes stop_codon:yes gene_type:complete
MMSAAISETFSDWDHHCMRLALDAAERAVKLGEVPVGALVARDEQVLAVAHNAVITQIDPTGHAEVLALREAAAVAGNYRLPGAALYVTLEPCTMCCGALIHARIERLVFATPEPKAGAVISTLKVLDNPQLNHRVSVQHGLEQDRASALLSDFFRARR